LVAISAAELGRPELVRHFASGECYEGRLPAARISKFRVRRLAPSRFG
jgi:hypothetical protein